MKFDLAKLDGNMKKATAFFLLQQGETCDEGGTIIEYKKIQDMTILVEFDGNKVVISAGKEVGFYRGLHLFLQEISIQGKTSFEIMESCRFLETGLMLDCSRNGTLSVRMVKEVISTCAAVGISQVYLYMEDVYEIPEEKYFGAFRGRYTYEELKDLDQYGIQMGVELIPAIQTLAHLHTYLKWPVAKELQDTEDIVLVGAERTQNLIRQFIHYASLPFSTKKIHVGMDEADLLGLGKYLKIHGYRERYQIMKEHLDMVYHICKEEGLEVIMWSDMFFRLKSPTGDYYDLPEDTEFDEQKDIPKDLSLVYWDYYHHTQKIYDKNIRLHRKLTDNIYFAGGGWTWNGLAPNYSKAKKTLKEGLISCANNGINQVFCTFWFDNGMETPARTILYSAIYFAQLCFYEEAETEKLNRWLKQFTGYTDDDFMLLDMFDSPEGVLLDNENADNPSKYLFYQDPLVGIFDGQVKNTSLDTYYSEIYNKINALKKMDNQMDDIFLYYKSLASVLKDKAMLGVKLRNAYQSKNSEELSLLKKCMENSLQNIRELKELRKKIWFNECKPFGYEVLDIRYGGVGTRMESSIQRIELYLQGRIDSIEELEEEMLIYNEDKVRTNHKHCMGGFWQDMVSAGNIAGI